MRFYTTKKDGSTGPTALESDGPYFKIMAHHKSEGLTLSRIIGYNEDVLNELQSAYLIITTIMYYRYLLLLVLNGGRSGINTQ